MPSLCSLSVGLFVVLLSVPFCLLASFGNIPMNSNDEVANSYYNSIGIFFSADRKSVTFDLSVLKDTFHVKVFQNIISSLTKLSFKNFQGTDTSVIQSLLHSDITHLYFEDCSFLNITEKLILDFSGLKKLTYLSLIRSPSPDIPSFLDSISDKRKVNLAISMSSVRKYLADGVEAGLLAFQSRRYIFDEDFRDNNIS